MITHTLQEAKDKATVWWAGEKVRFTGKVETYYGGLFGEAEVLEGHKKGELVSVTLYQIT